MTNALQKSHQSFSFLFLPNWDVLLGSWGHGSGAGRRRVIRRFVILRSRWDILQQPHGPFFLFWAFDMVLQSG